MLPYTHEETWLPILHLVTMIKPTQNNHADKFYKFNEISSSKHEKEKLWKQRCNTFILSFSLQFKGFYFLFLHIRNTKCTFVDKPNEEGNEVHTAILTNLLRPKEYFAKQIYKKSSHWASLKQKAIIFQLSGYTAVIKLLNFIQAPYVHLVFR